MTGEFGFMIWVLWPFGFIILYSDVCSMLLRGSCSFVSFADSVVVRVTLLVSWTACDF